MDKEELLALLEPLGIRPWRGRSQNFLLDGSVAQKMIAAAGISPGDRVVEVGAGPGMLTEALLDAGAAVAAVELDGRLCALLRQRFSSRKNFELFEGDVLEFPAATLSGGTDYAVVANLPYAITTPVIVKFLSEPPMPRSLTVMVQREVADRLLAGAGEMSSIAVFVQGLTEPHRVADVPRTAFFPSPKVDSAVIHMRVRGRDEISALFGNVRPETCFALAKTAFAGRRKQLKNSLRAAVSDGEKLKKAFVSAKISPSSRPEELVVKDWVRLAAAIAAQG